MASRILEQLAERSALTHAPRSASGPPLPAPLPEADPEPTRPTPPPPGRPTPLWIDTSELERDAPAKVGKYAVLGPLGEGGMSIVYRAKDEALDRLVALKVMHRHLARDPEARQRFSREARAVARLTHRNIPEIYDFSGASATDDAGTAYIVSELVDGASLARILREGPPLSPELGVMIVMGAGQALAHAHQHHVVHRDVKPENVLVGRDGVVKLTDFGIAHVRGLESMTMTGTLIGSPAHMAPEQIDGTKDLDARVDVWGFGTVLYMVATGGLLPFEADNPHHLLRKVAAGDYQDPRRVSPHVDAELAGIVRRCLTVDRAARYASIELVLADLARWLGARRLGAPEAEIGAFMADPVGFTALFAGRLVTAHLALGDEALARGDVSRALDGFGRVLALDPDHEVAFERVRRLQRRRRTKKGLVLGAVGLVLASVGTATALVVLAPDPVAPIAGAAMGGLGAVPAAPRIAARVAPELVPEAVPEAPRDGPWGAAFGAALATEATRVEQARSAAEARERDKEPRPRDDRKPKPEPVNVRVTVFPPAVSVSVAGKTVQAGAALRLVPGKYDVTLTHPGCPECAPDHQTLVVPEAAIAAGGYEQHFKFERRVVDFEPATLFVRCAAGGYAVDGAGKRYPCNVTHRLPVKSEKATLITLSVFASDGGLIHGPSSFTVAPKRPIVWDL